MKKIKELLIDYRVTIQKGIGSWFDFLIGTWKERWNMCLVFIICYAIFHLCSVYSNAEISKIMVGDWQSAFPMNHEDIYALFQVSMNLYLVVATIIYMPRAVLKHSWYNLLELICGQILLQVDLILYSNSILDLIVILLISYTIQYFLAAIYFKITNVPSRRIGKNSIVNEKEKKK